MELNSPHAWIVKQYKYFLQALITCSICVTKIFHSSINCDEF